jgi:hypothetical protein
MAISSVAISSFEQVSQRSLSTTTVKSNEEGEKPQTLTESREERREVLNQSILQANYNSSLGNKNDASALMFKTALDAINKELEPTLGKNAAQKAFDEGTDFSPEATAERIVSFATAFFPLYQQNHKEDSLEDQLTNFLDVVGGGAEKGFGEAKEILDGLGVFNGEIKENANKTRDLIFEGFDKFKESVLEASKKPEEEAPAV